MVKIPTERYEGIQLLKAPDLAKNEVEGIIESVRSQKLPQTGDTYMVKFYNYEKELALNKTNTKTLVDLFGDETDIWIDKKVKLIKVLVNNPKKGIETESIRIRVIL